MCLIFHLSDAGDGSCNTVPLSPNTQARIQFFVDTLQKGDGITIQFI